MERFKSKRIVLAGGLLAAIATLSACASKGPPPPPPPPPVVDVPPQPYPPLGAPPNLFVPPLGANGLRQTINTNLTPAQATWNFRSAYNVAALNCMKPLHAPILEGYREFLKAHAKKLAATNKAVDKEFKDRIGTAFVKAREAYMTQVYNYFALPPTLPAFCDAALAVSQQAKLVKSADLDSFAAASLSRLDVEFTEFYNSYDQYRTDLAAWQARYYPQTAVSAAPAITLPSTSPAAQPR